MMGTDANKDIFRNSGLITAEAESAAPNDMVIVVETLDEKVVENVLRETDKFLNDLAVSKNKNNVEKISGDFYLIVCVSTSIM